MQKNLKNTLRQMKKEGQCILLKVPSNTEVYIFGSAIYSNKPNDIDLLIVYDSTFHSPKEIYDKFYDFKLEITRVFCLEAHMIFVSHEEERETNFINKVNAVPVITIIQDLLKRLKVIDIQ